MRRKGLPIQMKTKQSMEMQVVSLVILEIYRQLGSDSCLLMTTIEIPGFTTADMVVWFRSQRKKMELIICILTRPSGSPKYCMTRKNMQR